MPLLRFSDFVKESGATASVYYNPKVPKAPKPALYKVGDLLMSIRGKEYRMSGNFSRAKAEDNGIGMLLKVEKVEQKSNKWFYTCELVAGGYRKDESGSRGTSSLTAVNYYKISGVETNFTTEGVKELRELAKSPQFKKGDSVIVSKGVKLLTPQYSYGDDNKEKYSFSEQETASTEQRKILCLGLHATLFSKEICYVLDQSRGTSVYCALENSIETNQELQKEEIELLSQEIAKRLGVDFSSKESEDKVQFTPEYVKDDNLKGFKLWFKNLEDKSAFAKAFNELVNDFADPSLQKTFGGKIDFQKNLAEKTSDWSKPEIKTVDLVAIAQNLGIDTKTFFHDHRGKLTASKFNF